jgi:hypothetical protein
MFTVICLETGSAALDCNGQPLEYETGELAAAIAFDLTRTTGKKHQPRRKKNTSSDWRERERKRFADGTYVAAPWVNEYWHGLNADGLRHDAVQDHFVHVSTEEPGKIAFTENAEKGEADRQTRMRPGRYLQQFYSYIGENACKHYANQFAGMYEPTTVLFGETADDFERVYTEGPNSCMSHRAGEYSSPFHPVRVYATGDIQVAYIENDNEITARVLVNKETKRFSRVYGDESRLGAALNKLGYHYSGSALQGCRMTRAMDDHDRYIVPYVDGVYRCRDDGEYLVCDGRGEISCENTCGLSEALAICEHCEEPTADTYTVDGEQWCEDCRDNHAMWCDWHEEYCTGQPVFMAGGDAVWCESAFEDHGTTCDGTGDNIPNDDAITLADGTTWSQNHFDNHGFECEHCHESFSTDDMARRGSPGVEYVCTSCNEDNPENEATEAAPRPQPLDHARLLVGMIVDARGARNMWCRTGRYRITAHVPNRRSTRTNRLRWLYVGTPIEGGDTQHLAACNIVRVVEPDQIDMRFDVEVAS